MDIIPSSTSSTDDLTSEVTQYVKSTYERIIDFKEFKDAMEINRKSILDKLLNFTSPFKMTVLILHQHKKTKCFTFEVEYIDVFHPVERSKEGYYRVLSPNNYNTHFDFYLDENTIPVCFLPESLSCLFCFECIYATQYYDIIDPIKTNHDEMRGVLYSLQNATTVEKQEHYKRRLAFFIYNYKKAFEPVIIKVITIISRYHKKY